jgi:hypothetical protein
MNKQKRLKPFGNVSVRGHNIPVVFAQKLEKAHATVDAPGTKNRKIKILADVVRDDPLYLFELLAHETLHVAFWDIDEEAIDETGYAMRLLLVNWLKFLLKSKSPTELLTLIETLNEPNKS